MPMNLHAIVAPMIDFVTGSTIGIWRRSAGTYTTTPDGERVPDYVDVPDVAIRVQALEGEDLRLVESLNIQGVKRSVFMEGDVQAIDRASRKGGDLLVFNDAVWLVTLVLETWDGSNWCNVAVTKQTDAPPPLPAPTPEPTP